MTRSYDDHLDDWQASIAERAMSYDGLPREEAETEARQFIDQYRRPEVSA